ncbi:MAG: hypothetical protein GYB65_03865 [Chloroflexi bacterium]|nr:hypothetical protein [Chloroflexota bacterium]
MDNERSKILQMVQDGTITAEEGSDLLAAFPTDESEPVERAIDSAPTTPSDTRQFPRPWQWPLGIGLTLAGVGNFLRKDSGWLGKPLGWLMMGAGGLTAIVGWQSRHTPWVHVRIEEKDGHRIALSLPLPLGLAQWGLNFARQYVDEETAEHLDIAAGLLEVLLSSPSDEPLSVEVDDDDGDHIRVFIG